jgi:pSer/pThr/pTyr-binding forkhead associated (FHA) protein
VTSSAVAGDVVWQAALDIDGRRYPLTRARTVIGRGSDSDIPLADAGTSRRHVEVLWDGKRGMVHDLGSTNGSRLDGQMVSRALLADGQTITIGRTNIVFRVLASQAGRQVLAGQQNATQIIDDFQRGQR